MVVLPDTEFIKTFRLSKSVVKNIAEPISPFIPDERRSDDIPVLMKANSLLFQIITYKIDIYLDLS